MHKLRISVLMFMACCLLAACSSPPEPPQPVGEKVLINKPEIYNLIQMQQAPQSASTPAQKTDLVEDIPSFVK